MRHIPAWVPWLSYKPAAREGYDAGQDVLRYPIQFVKDGLVRFMFVRGESASLSDDRLANHTEKWHRPLVLGTRKFAGNRENAY